jgi:two-component system LytT family sensor kinase
VPSGGVDYAPAVAALRVIGVYTIVALLFAGQVWLDYAYARVPVSGGRAALVSAIDWYLWAAFTPVVLWLGRRFPLRRGAVGRALAIHLPACIVLAAIKIPAQEALAAVVAGVVRSPASFLKVYVTISVYWIILGVGFALQQARELRAREVAASRLEAELASAQLDVLRMRLHPHFLFNTLNGISALMRENVEAADLMLTRLSDLLRLALDRADVQEVTLQEELEFVRKFLEIQSVRFGDRLTVRLDVDANALPLAVPSLALQPLAENAVRHGVERKPGPATVTIRARRTAMLLVVEIEDDGPGPPADPRTGTGLEATRRRLAHLHGDAGSLLLLPAERGGAVARLTVPARELPP